MDIKKQKLWAERLEKYKESGLSGRRWCEEQGVSEYQFWYWKKGYRYLRTPSKSVVSEATMMAFVHVDFSHVCAK